MSKSDQSTTRPGELSRRQFLTVGGGAVAAAALAACAPAATPAPTSAPAATEGPTVVKADMSKVMTGYDNPNWSHHAADIVARAKGWMNDGGISELEVITFDDSMTAIIGGGVNISAVDTDVVMPAHVDNEVDIWWLGTRRDSEDLIFGLAPGITIESLKGSKAQVSGGAVGSRNELLGKKMLAELGLDPENDVEWITMSGGSDTRLAALINGNLSGSNIQVRHITQLEEAGGIVAYNKSRIIAQDGYVAMGSMINDHRPTVQAFFNAIVKAKIYMKDLANKDEVIQIMKDAGYEFPQEFIDAYDANINNMSPDGGFEIKDMELVWEELSAVGEAPADFDWRKAVNMDIMWAAQEANGLPRRPASL